MLNLKKNKNKILNNFFLKKENKIIKKQTKPELEMEKILKELNLKFIKEFSISSKFGKKKFDFYVFDNINNNYEFLIEVDGDFFHVKERKKKLYKFQKKNLFNDKIKNLIAKKKNLKLLRFWESDILSPEKREEIKEKILNEIKIQNNK